MRPGAQLNAPPQPHGVRPAGAQFQRRLRVRVRGPVSQAREAPFRPCEPNARIKRRVEVVVPSVFEQVGGPDGRVGDVRRGFALVQAFQFKQSIHAGHVCVRRDA